MAEESATGERERGRGRAEIGMRLGGAGNAGNDPCGAGGGGHAGGMVRAIDHINIVVADKVKGIISWTAGTSGRRRCPGDSILIGNSWVWIGYQSNHWRSGTLGSRNRIRICRTTYTINSHDIIIVGAGRGGRIGVRCGGTGNFSKDCSVAINFIFKGAYGRVPS